MKCVSHSLNINKVRKNISSQIILICYPFDCSEAFVAKNDDNDHWKSEANGEKEEIVTKVIGSGPGGAAAGTK